MNILRMNELEKKLCQNKKNWEVELKKNRKKERKKERMQINSAKKKSQKQGFKNNKHDINKYLYIKHKL